MKIELKYKKKDFSGKSCLDDTKIKMKIIGYHININNFYVELKELIKKHSIRINEREKIVEKNFIE